MNSPSPGEPISGSPADQPARRPLGAGGERAEHEAIRDSGGRAAQSKHPPRRDYLGGEI